MTNISAKGLNTILLIQRVITAVAFAFFAIGQMLHLNALTQNGIDLGLPYSAQFCIVAVIITFLAALMLLMGFFTRTATWLLMAASLFSGFFFFAGTFNKVNLVGVLLALALLSGLSAMGPGAFSIDGYLAQNKIRNNKRLSFR